MAPGAPSLLTETLLSHSTARLSVSKLAARSAKRDDPKQTQENNIVPKSQELQR